MRSNTIFHPAINHSCDERESLLRTGGDERFGGRLAHEMGEREWGADALERAQVPEDHRGLARPEAENGLVGLPPFFVEKPRTCLRVWAGWTLCTPLCLS